MAEAKKYPGKTVFGLDIGTRSVVGTVGYKNGKEFRVIAQRVSEHESRAMIDGQIHDIIKVGEIIADVRRRLEEATQISLSEVCIAAAGRVLRTVNCLVEWPFVPEREVTNEDIYALASMGVEKAYAEFEAGNETESKFYCVGYSVVRYYLNGYQIGNLEGHKAKVIGADIIATFLPDDVVNGLYKAVEYAKLDIVSLTLEPIAAIQVAIPEKYRMLNIALVDVGAGTSDISITKDGSIISYGMIAIAGDALTEKIASHCLVDFATAEQIKRDAGINEVINYTDIMFLPQSIPKDEILTVVDDILKTMTKEVALKIRELNGNKSVSAVFVVGGGGKIPGYTDALADALEIARERVALRGEEVMQQIVFEEETKKDSLLVTPIGICLNYFEQSNNFIFVSFNGGRLKIYDNNRLAVVDAAMQAQFPNDALFPRRGQALTYYLNGNIRMVRGQSGETAVISLNGEAADIYTSIHSNDVIVVKESTEGEPGRLSIGEIKEIQDTIVVNVNDKKVELPIYAWVNGELQSVYYEIQEGDEIELADFYTVKQIAEFMDVILDKEAKIYVNNKEADESTPVYRNFSVTWPLKEQKSTFTPKKDAVTAALKDEYVSNDDYESRSDYERRDDYENEVDSEIEDDYENEGPSGSEGDYKGETKVSRSLSVPNPDEKKMTISVNGDTLLLSGKAKYVFVDIFEFIDFDLNNSKGRHIVTRINNRDAQFMEPLSANDLVEIYWE
ncbi:MAG: pilus assembly protein PilM [Lachnospiraceae bacterium]|nr:pilus assembly protein PilM [Lachnospiraceae bacterium]